MDLNVNGRRHTIQSDPERPLLYVLRDELDLTGAKEGIPLCWTGNTLEVRPGSRAVVLDHCGKPVGGCLGA